MAQTVLITLTLAGTDTGPFDLYSDVDGYVSAFETGVSKVSLVGGYVSVLVPDGTTIIRVKSTGLCPNYIDLAISGITTTTTTSSSSTTTTSTSSTTTTSTSSTTTTSTSSTSTTTTTAVPCNDYFNNTGSPITGVDYTACDGTPVTNDTVNPGQSICVQGSPSGGDSGFLILLGNC
jgi:hypothetical protein